ncbi:hypothetical protein CEXT_47491 [Caerostris extrusa]|uniref:Uncharacterized protein n=1 Tax=Caerostris extrusa TaxID=172846 RepID=A0AAV4VK18_CAEEX|nr:hypothetical protein CEXT_47491 [Caerostris extrusa]
MLELQKGKKERKGGCGGGEEKDEIRKPPDSSRLYGALIRIKSLWAGARRIPPHQTALKSSKKCTRNFPRVVFPRAVWWGGSAPPLTGGRFVKQLWREKSPIIVWAEETF